MMSLLKHRYVVFTSARYAGYVLLFIRGLIIAAVLGPHALGIWGFISLLIEYLSYGSLGLPYAVNVELSVRGKNDQQYARTVIDHSVGILIIISAFVLTAGIFFQQMQIDFFPQYSILPFTILIVVIASLMHLFNVFVNVFRAYDRIMEVVIAELTVTVLTLSAAVFIPSESLISGLIWTMLAGYVFADILLIVRSPVRFQPRFDLTYAQPIVKQGLALLVYNLSFYLMTMIARSVVGIAYPVKEMGYFTLANSLASATMLGINSIVWIIYPKILHAFRESVPDDQAEQILTEITRILSFGVYGIIFSAAAVSPVILGFLPEYRPIFPTLHFLLLSQAFLLNCTAANSFAVARKKEIIVARLGIFMVIVLLAAYGVAVSIGLTVYGVSAILLLVSVFYNVIMNYYTMRLLGDRGAFRTSAKLSLAPSFSIPALLLVGVAISPFSLFAGSIALLGFILINAAEFAPIVKRVQQLTHQSSGTS